MVQQLYFNESNFLKKEKCTFKEFAIILENTYVNMQGKGQGKIMTT